MFTGEVAITSILVLILVLLTNPTNLLMPKTADTMLQFVFVLVFLVFSAFFWKEQSVDEREEVHKNKAGRVSFLIGTTVLAIGIIYQSLSHNIDIWLVIALMSMIVAKVVTHMYNKVRN